MYVLDGRGKGDGLEHRIRSEAVAAERLESAAFGKRDTFQNRIFTEGTVSYCDDVFFKAGYSCESQLSDACDAVGNDDALQCRAVERPLAYRRYVVADRYRTQRTAIGEAILGNNADPLRNVYLFEGTATLKCRIADLRDPVGKLQ